MLKLLNSLDSSMLILMLILIFFLSLEQNTFALSQNDFFFVEKQSCDLRLAPMKKNGKFLQKDIVNSLKNKGYNVLFFLENKRVIPGEDYIKISIFKTGGFWKKCGIEMVLSKSKLNRPSKDDQIILKHQTIRSLPRVTPSGNERCVRALKDLLVQLPYCKKNN